MRIANKMPVLLCGALTASVMLWTGSVQAAPQAVTSGITVAPAAIRLELAKSQHTATATVTLTNTYQTDVTLRFTLEPPVQSAAMNASVIPQLSLAYQEVVLPAGRNIQQTITLHDSVAIEPGSQQLDMVVAQQGITATGVGVLSGVRLPVTVIKQDGAVARLELTNIAGARFATSMPNNTTLTLRNTGNMVSIPHGTVMVHAPDGTVIGKGTLNEASKAIPPGATIAFTAPITQLRQTATPGRYRISVQYSLGGDSIAVARNRQFLYIAWWHIAVLSSTAGLGWALYNHAGWLRRHGKASGRTGMPKRRLLIGRDST